MLLEHIAHGFLCERHNDRLYLMGRVVEHEQYVYEEGDLFLPSVGGIFVTDELQTAILSGTFNGRLVPYEILIEPHLVDEKMLLDFDEQTQRLVARSLH